MGHAPLPDKMHKHEFCSPLFCPAANSPASEGFIHQERGCAASGRGFPGRFNAPGVTADLTQRRVFDELIHPILQWRCSACHGLEKHKADLSIESYETLLEGGKDSPVLIAGKSLDSSISWNSLAKSAAGGDDAPDRNEQLEFRKRKYPTHHELHPPPRFKSHHAP